MWAVKYSMAHAVHVHVHWYMYGLLLPKIRMHHRMPRMRQIHVYHNNLVLGNCRGLGLGLGLGFRGVRNIVVCSIQVSTQKHSLRTQSKF